MNAIQIKRMAKPTAREISECLKDHPITIDPQNLSVAGENTRNLLSEMYDRLKIIGAPTVNYNDWKLKPKSSTVVIIRFTRVSYVANGVLVSFHVMFNGSVLVGYNNSLFRRVDRLMSEVVEYICGALTNEASARAVLV